MSAVLFYTIGLPGAGKTTFAQNLARQLGGEHIYGDKVGYQLFTQPKFTPEEVQLVRSTMEQMTKRALASGHSVVYDALLLSRSLRQYVADIARSQGKQAVGVWMQTPEQVARTRSGVVRFADFAKDYKRIVPPEVFNRHLQAFEEPQTNEHVIKIWGTASFSMQYTSLRSALREMNISPW